MRDRQFFGEHWSELRVALVVALQAGEDQIELLLRHRRGQCGSSRERIGRRERIILDMQRAIGAAGKGFANHLLDARRPGRADDDLAAMLFAKTQGLLERVGIRLVHLVADILVADPGLVVVQARLPLTSWDLLNTDGDFH